MEIAMKTGGLYNHNYFGGGTALCVDGLRRKVDLPKDVRKIYAVFTQKKVSDSFYITKPRECSWMGRESRIRGFSGSLRISTRWKLAEAYDKGFRYVRIEY